MPLDFEQAVRRAFSAAAQRYETVATLQQEIGARLAASIAVPRGTQRVLDIGMGTGRLTETLARICPGATVVGVDAAWGMVSQARIRTTGVYIIQADARLLPFKSHSFDVAFSNLMYQWVDNLPAAFESAYRIVRPGGVFYFSCFGAKTLCELFHAVNATHPAARQRDILNNERLASCEHIQNALRAARFCNIDVRAELKTVSFDGMFTLLRWLKHTGANRAQPRAFIGRDALRSADIFYRKHFSHNGGVRATFELVWGSACAR